MVNVIFRCIYTQRELIVDFDCDEFLKSIWSCTSMSFCLLWRVVSFAIKPHLLIFILPFYQKITKIMLVLIFVIGQNLCCSDVNFLKLTCFPRFWFVHWILFSLNRCMLIEQRYTTVVIITVWQYQYICSS